MFPQFQRFVTFSVMSSLAADASTTRQNGGTGLGLGKESAFTVRFPAGTIAPEPLLAATGGISERQLVHA
jgi:hypothetical protein